MRNYAVLFVLLFLTAPRVNTPPLLKLAITTVKAFDTQITGNMPIFSGVESLQRMTLLKVPQQHRTAPLWKVGNFTTFLTLTTFYSFSMCKTLISPTTHLQACIPIQEGQIDDGFQFVFVLCPSFLCCHFSRWCKECINSNSPNFGNLTEFHCSMAVTSLWFSLLVLSSSHLIMMECTLVSFFPLSRWKLSFFLFMWQKDLEKNVIMVTFGMNELNWQQLEYSTRTRFSVDIG